MSGFWRFNFLGSQTRRIFVASLSSVLMTNAFAQPTPPTPPVNITPAAGNYTTVAGIEALYNNCRDQEAGYLGITIPHLVMPSQTEWDATSVSQRALFLLNAERTARGLLPFELVHPIVQDVAQSYAQYLVDNDVFSHDADGLSPSQRFANAGVSGFRGETLAAGAVIEKAIIMWIYQTASYSWGHRNICLYSPFINDLTSPLSEGWIGVGYVVDPGYLSYGRVVVFDMVDPVLATVCQEVPVRAGWNIVSVPTRPADSSVGALFPGATSPAFGYDNSYNEVTHMSSGDGYWLKFDSPGMVNVCGKPVWPQAVAVSSGWNIIGPFEEEVAVAGITSTPPGLITSNFYEYEDGYTAATKLVPGLAYWVKASGPGVLSLEGTITKVGSITLVDREWITLSVRDASGHSAMLYLTQEDITGYKPDLPPVPPGGIFDVRFAGGRYVEQAYTQNEIRMSGVVYPVSLHAMNLQGATLRVRYRDGTGLVEAELNDGETMTVQNEVQTLDVHVHEEAPIAFALSQNYPNPFNPTTEITYTIPGIRGQEPEVSSVRLVVYDPLGREVSTLVNQQKKAGTYAVTFNATQLSSGVYLYRLTSGSNTDVKKMLYLK